MKQRENAERCTMYSFPNIVRHINASEYVTRIGKDRKVYKVLIGESGGKRPLGRTRRKWKDGIKMDLRFGGVCAVNSPGSG
jgi:hypothetical protein